MKALIPVEVIEQRILLIRGQRVMLDADLAMLYGVPTRVLNQAVRRNLKRFPQDFMFKLSQPEKDQVITICDHLKNLKYAKALPNAFTPLENRAIYSGDDRDECSIPHRTGGESPNLSDGVNRTWGDYGGQRSKHGKGHPNQRICGASLCQTSRNVVNA